MRQSKRIACLGLVALLLACGWGCGPKEQSDPGKDVDMAALAQAMLDADPTLPEMASSTGSSPASPRRAGSRSNALAMAWMMALPSGESAQRQGTSREYDPSQVPLTEGAVIVREGRYVALIVCQKSGLVQNVFRDSFREN